MILGEAPLFQEDINATPSGETGPFTTTGEKGPFNPPFWGRGTRCIVIHVASY